MTERISGFAVAWRLRDVLFLLAGLGIGGEQPIVIAATIESMDDMLLLIPRLVSVPHGSILAFTIKLHFPVGEPA